MAFIRQKNNKHKDIQQIDFHQFKMDMMNFCKKLCTFEFPFLHKVKQSRTKTCGDKICRLKCFVGTLYSCFVTCTYQVAQQAIDKRLEKQDDAASDVQDKPGPSFTLQFMPW